MASIATGEANKILDALWGTAPYAAATAPIKGRLMTANGSPRRTVYAALTASKVLGVGGSSSFPAPAITHTLG